ncbi:MAG: radical SAM family heme chaperone HemW [Gammaproteobacteria bacterium]|nr:radical SAM family heme chaperone HemW [Gammaproteobacteria bacterium]
MIGAQTQPAAALGLYVHFPWCVRKCPYCDFNSHPLRGALQEPQYLEVLLDDLAQEAERHGNRAIASVFLGGGTPSLFSPEAMRALLSAPVVAGALEVTMEANPGAVEHGSFRAYRKAGVTRVSLGAQSFDPAQLQTLGRIHSPEETDAALAEVRGAGFTSFNIDLMHGLPGQTEADALADLERAIRHDPPHISWYQLTIEPKTEFARRPPAGLPDSDAAADMEAAGVALLERHGYRRYEVSAFARPGHECRHNINYWRFGDYLGIGAGAHGKHTSFGGDGKAAVLRTAKPSQPRLYLADHCAATTPVASEELAFEFLLNALRLTDGAEWELFSARTGLSRTTIEPTVSELIAWGLMRSDRIALTPEGRVQLDAVVSRFLKPLR